MTEFRILLGVAVMVALLLACGCTESARPIPASLVTPERTTAISPAPVTPATTAAMTTATTSPTTATTAPVTTATTSPTTATTTTTPTAPTTVPGKNILDTITADGRFTILLNALNASKVDGVLAGEGPFTLFAPTDDAFGKLPAGTLENLLAEPKGELRLILFYHVVPQKLTASDLSKLTTVTSLLESDLTISTTGGLTIDSAKVVTPDIQCSNGVVHAIDTVMMPPI